MFEGNNTNLLTLMFYFYFFLAAKLIRLVLAYVQLFVKIFVCVWIFVIKCQCRYLFHKIIISWCQYIWNILMFYNILELFVAWFNISQSKWHCFIFCTTFLCTKILFVSCVFNQTLSSFLNKPIIKIYENEIKLCNITE